MKELIRKMFVEMFVAVLIVPVIIFDAFFLCVERYAVRRFRRSEPGMRQSL